MDLETVRSAKQALKEELGFFTEHCLIPEMCGIGIGLQGGYHISISLEREISAAVKQKYSSYRGVRVEFKVTGIAVAY